MLLMHGHLGEQMLVAARVILKRKLERVVAMPFEVDIEAGVAHRRINSKITKLSESGPEILVLCDTFGASATQLVASREHPAKIKIACVFGVNLPMLLESIALRNKMELEQLAKHVCSIGQQAIFWQLASLYNK